MSNGKFKINNKVLRDKGLHRSIGKSKGFSVYFLLCRRATCDNVSFISITNIIKQLNMYQRKRDIEFVKKTLSSLKKNKLIDFDFDIDKVDNNDELEILVIEPVSNYTYFYTDDVELLKKIGHKSFAVYAYIYIHYNKEFGYAFPEFQNISHDLSMSYETVKDNVDLLEETGIYFINNDGWVYDKKLGRKRRSNNMYQLNLQSKKDFLEEKVEIVEDSEIEKDKSENEVVDEVSNTEQKNEIEPTVDDEVSTTLSTVDNINNKNNTENWDEEEEVSINDIIDNLFDVDEDESIEITENYVDEKEEDCNSICDNVVVEDNISDEEIIKQEIANFRSMYSYIDIETCEKLFATDEEIQYILSSSEFLDADVESKHEQCRNMLNNSLEKLQQIQSKMDMQEEIARYNNIDFDIVIEEDMSEIDNREQQYQDMMSCDVELDEIDELFK